MVLVAVCDHIYVCFNVGQSLCKRLLLVNVGICWEDMKQNSSSPVRIRIKNLQKLTEKRKEGKFYGFPIQN